MLYGVCLCDVLCLCLGRLNSFVCFKCEVWCDGVWSVVCVGLCVRVVVSCCVFFVVCLNVVVYVVCDVFCLCVCVF